ncbi:hypothetical protein [Edaphobacter bradus]|uniref:hypothetical protein n=1 Tax=Edaphobacter bradus TaxID=2259016 RepID=UPI0021DFAD45|nr:hypothetical protein [Edaphobacter bradus]
MSFRTWFRGSAIQKTSPRTEEVVRKVSVYLQSRPEQTVFYPQVVAAAVHESEAAVLAAFSILEDEGIASPRYGTFCKRDSVPLDEFKLGDELPEISLCPSCDEEVSLRDGTMEAELYFVVGHEKLSRRMKAAA